MTTREKLAIQFEGAVRDVSGVGLSLGVWAGRGDWSTMRRQARDAAGQRALADLASALDRLHAVQARLAAAITNEDEALLDDFAWQVLQRCRETMTIHYGRPAVDWPVPEQLAVALVTDDDRHLRRLGYTRQQAIDNVTRAMTEPPQDTDAWVRTIRDLLTESGPANPRPDAEAADTDDAP